MNQQQQAVLNNGPNTGVGGSYAVPRQDMEYLCAGKMHFVAILPVHGLTLHTKRLWCKKRD